MIVVVMGLSGTGKSFLASILSQDFGFEWLRSDQIRKELAGLQAGQKARTSYGQGIYSPEWTRRVYEQMIRMAEEKLKSGRSVVLDATFLEEWQRNMVKERFPDAIFILTQAQEGEVLKRLKEREDISDADVEIYLLQKKRFVPPDYAIEVNTEKSREELRDVLREILQKYELKDTEEPAV